MRFLLLSLLFSCSSAFAGGYQTSYSALLARIQQTYLTDAAPYPILIMDRDELEWRFARAGAIGEEGESARQEIVKAYVRERTGVEINHNAAANFEPYLAVLKDAAVAMPALKDGFASGIAMCAVFPPDANRNRRLEAERILQLKLKDAYGEKDFARLRDSLSYDDAVLISVLHEAGHCMDRFFFPQMYQGGDDPHTIHQAESYAETMAILLMAREGRRVAGPRAYMRDVYSFFMQPWFAANADKGLMSPGFSYGGLVYHLSPSIRAAQALLESEPGFETQPLPALQEKAAEIVRAHSFRSPLMTALHAAYTEGREAAYHRYEDLKERMPELFGEVLEKMRAYFLREEEFRAGAFLAEAVPAGPETPLLPLDTLNACAHYRGGHQSGLLAEIERLRQDLRQGNPSPAAEAARFDALSNLWSRLPAVCRGESLLASVAKERSERAQLLRRLPPRTGGGCDLAWMLKAKSRF